MENLIPEFCEYQKNRKDSSENTLAAYRADLGRLAVFLSQNHRTDFIHATNTQMNSFLLYLEKAGNRPTTIRRVFSTIRSFYDFLCRKGVVNEDPTLKMKLPKVEAVGVEVISEEDMTRLLEAPDTDTMRGIRDRAMLELLYATGIRLNTLLDLTVEAFTPPYPFLSFTENNKERVFPLGKPAYEALRAYLATARSSFLKDRSNTDLLFLNRFGEKMTRQGFYKILSEYAAKLSLNNVSPRVFRNSLVVHMMAHGASKESMNHLLGTTHLAASEHVQSIAQNMLELYKNAHPRAK